MAQQIILMENLEFALTALTPFFKKVAKNIQATKTSKKLNLYKHGIRQRQNWTIFLLMVIAFHSIGTRLYYKWFIHLLTSNGDRCNCWSQRRLECKVFLLRLFRIWLMLKCLQERLFFIFWLEERKVLTMHLRKLRILKKIIILLVSLIETINQPFITLFRDLWKPDSLQKEAIFQQKKIFLFIGAPQVL